MAAIVSSDDHRPIVGRVKERAKLQQILDATVTGTGRLVLVSGEAGIGKTTLIEDVARKATEHDMLVLSGGCYDLTTTPPYGPWVEMLDTYPVSIDLPALPVELRGGGGLEQIASQEQLFRIIAGFLTDIAAATPAILILEDLHWADHASVELLRFLARQLARQRLLLLVSYRDEELNRNHPLFTLLPMLVREARAHRIELEHFDAETLRGLVAQQYELSDHDRDALATYLLHHTEGNPLFVVELLRSLERELVLSESDQGWHIGDLDNIAPPPLVVQMIERHLTALEPGTREALEIAALLGQEVVVGYWQQLARLENDRISQIIEQALLTRIIEPSGESGLRFRHALIREVLYQGMLFPRRCRLHRQAAELLIEAGSPDPNALAAHFQRAGDERAVEWLIEAGRRAERAGALIAAVDRYEEAFRLLERDDARLNEQGWVLLRIAQLSRERAAHRSIAAAEAAQRIAEATCDAAMAAWALWDLGMMRFYVGENGLAEMEQGLAALQRLPQGAFERIPAPFQHIYLRYSDASFAIMQALFGHYQDGLTTASRFLANRPSPDSIRLWNEHGHAQAARAHALSALGDPPAARQSFHSTQEAYRMAGNTWLRALNATTELQYVVLAFDADHRVVRQRKMVAAEALWDEVSGVSTQLPARFGLLPLLVVEGAWAEAQEIATPFANRDTAFHYVGLCALGQIAHARGERDSAWRLVTAGIPDGPDTEPGVHLSFFTLELYRLAVTLALDAEDLDLARSWIESHDHWLDWSERIQGRAESQLLWARYHQVIREHERAVRHAWQALEFASNPRQPLTLIAARRMLGELALAAEQHDEADGHLRQSLDLAVACAAPYEQALTLLALAELGSTTANPDAAWRSLDKARSICIPLDALPALQRASEITARLAVQRRKHTHPAGLTPREAEVLQLVADGLTDAEIAERLFVSPRTVGSHLTSIYNKLGVNSRVAASRFAIEHGLTDPSFQ